jgi:hypothetical protein
MTKKKVWSRRQFSKAIISAQVLLASGALTFPIACNIDKKVKENVLFLDSELETLKYAMDEIIPANNKMPSASEVEGVKYILNVLDELPELLPVFQSLLSNLEDKSREKSNKNFISLNKIDRVKVLESLEKTSSDLFAVIKNFTYESYYTNSKVYELIGYEPHPTGTMGPKMEPFDEKLLDRVKAMPPMYTKV